MRIAADEKHYRQRCNRQQHDQGIRYYKPGFDIVSPGAAVRGAL
jgi:hypothetical protein